MPFLLENMDDGCPGATSLTDGPPEEATWKDGRGIAGKGTKSCANPVGAIMGPTSLPKPHPTMASCGTSLEIIMGWNEGFFTRCELCPPSL